jgi:predicted enzyme related to lactoylglutathione lyase
MPNIIWRELMSRDVESAKQFYSDVFGWSFVVEQATDFAWGDGPGAYHLIRSEQAIHGGFLQPTLPIQSGWIAYFGVKDMPSAIAQTEQLGGEVVRAPFTVKGIGQNAIMRSPTGIVFGLTIPSYPDAPPTGLFCADMILTGEPEATAEFFAALWQQDETEDEPPECLLPPSESPQTEGWVPVVQPPNYDAICSKARQNAAQAIIPIADRKARHLIIDPLGHQIVIQKM